jgi:hypothetical protein
VGGQERLRSVPAALSASQGLASLAFRFFAFSLSLDAWFFVERPQLHFLEDAFGCHLLLEDFYCSLQRTFDLNFHNKRCPPGARTDESSPERGTLSTFDQQPQPGGPDASGPW